jgi:hypothetical protein
MRVCIALMATLLAVTLSACGVKPSLQEMSPGGPPRTYPAPDKSSY